MRRHGGHGATCGPKDRFMSDRGYFMIGGQQKPLAPTDENFFLGHVLQGGSQEVKVSTELSDEATTTNSNRTLLAFPASSPIETSREHAQHEDKTGG
jgi:hypothetical protein